MLQLPQLNRGCSKSWAWREAPTSSISTPRGRRSASATASPPSSYRAICSRSGSIRFRSGLSHTSALLGSAASTSAVGVMAPRYHLRLQLACAGLMVVTGIAFPSLQHLVFIAVVAFIGTINPTTGDIGVHVPLEQAALAHRASDAERTHIFARYSLVGALSIAAGALAAGAPDLLVSLGAGKIGALQAM